MSTRGTASVGKQHVGHRSYPGLRETAAQEASASPEVRIPAGPPGRTRDGRPAELPGRAHPAVDADFTSARSTAQSAVQSPVQGSTPAGGHGEILRLPSPHGDRSGGPTPVVRGLAEGLLRQLPHLVEELMELTVGRGVRHLELVPGSEIRRSLHENVLGFLRILAGKPPADSNPLAVPMAWGHYRAQEGVSVESLLRVHRLATQLLWEKLFDEARALSPEVLQRLLDESGPVWDALDSYSQAFVEGHRVAEADAQRRSTERRETVIDALIEGRGVEPVVAAEAQVTLGLPARGRFVVIAMADGTVPSGEHDADGFGSGTPRALRHALPSHAVLAVWRRRTDRHIGLLELGSTSLGRLVEALSAGVGRRVGISCEVDSLSDIATAYHCAETALQTLPAATEGVAAFDDHLLEALVVTSPHVAQRLARHTFGRLLDCPQEERDLLLATLDAWFRGGCSAARAADELHCHRNTVLNRLRRIETLTGSMLDDDRHQLACRMALVAVRCP
ncbi:PucR family transcriptional regulator [Streptomyces sp. RKAG293]|uniref:PucR family transcriptional regulator n=1 Tax=Streptomyces sp. RKAG293 TaxID=2893403 RepID=UPI002034758E|nr:PucR family transcriptional regulator [Streptomyces sp. RKAG293]MCM2417092.1 helix-turn-helix domain-containing protein [Streptomyces sp. RKAG293]